ncbi:hypothetical protein THASP1DRAFT_31705 [Thamnocephalis sphaerospora]|uniref:NodB homology domain-containing protein n=1 Tax=Thamnocephalis sphaerospora TaxID=78915 RepID=A0A4P9XMI6_9FUNG|nr:hypothetical protein THASP1DRAFT_32346 [Thamnocephalis sphaerospora]RKP06480.1 hypothetical protein THASP1DRAFT_31705 [Thamnocephalis sphaerospora]|eukprot:RKP05821.1 hypothetical protein THASP1DRAFT_32346 [Thamnocephalis sphaerospora]
MLLATTVGIVIWQPGMIALTFDDGPGKSTSNIVDTLNRLGVKATFFVNGNAFVDQRRSESIESLRKTYNSGHQIASHTFTHTDLAKLNADQVRGEMVRLDDLLHDLIGIRPMYMRPPYGSLTNEALDALNNQGYHVVIWNLDTFDWKHPEDSEALYARYHQRLQNADPKSESIIGLEHDVHAGTNGAVVERIVELAHSRGFRFVRIDECLGNTPPAYRT